MLKKGLTLFAGLVLVLAVLSILRMRPVHATVHPPAPPPTAGYAKSIGAIGLVKRNRRTSRSACRSPVW